VAIAGSLAGIGLAAGVLHARQAGYPLQPSVDRFLYLNSGKSARRAALTFDALAADLYWIRAIQHYGRDRKRPDDGHRFELLQPLLDITTTLDPHFNIAYRFGAIFLALEGPNGPHRPDQAIALLEKGLQSNPNRWQYAFDIAFVHYWNTNDFAAAADWFDRAAAMPNAPEWLKPMAAMARLQGGDRAHASQLLNELLNSEESWIRQAAKRGLDQIEAMKMIDALQAAVEDYHVKRGEYPQDLPDLIRLGYPPAPPDPTGVPFKYDAKQHVVTVSEKSSLNPLPTSIK
jgi:hypothetical protein